MEEHEVIKKMVKIYNEVSRDVSLIAAHIAGELAEGREPDECMLIFYLSEAYKNAVGRKSKILEKLEKACEYLKDGMKVVIEPP